MLKERITSLFKKLFKELTSYQTHPIQRIKNKEKSCPQERKSSRNKILNLTVIFVYFVIFFTINRFIFTMSSFI